MRIAITIFFILSVSVKSYATGNDTTRVDLTYEGLDLNWIITSKGYNYIDSLNQNGDKIKVLNQIHKNYTNNRKKTIEICYFITQNFVLEKNGHFKILMLKVLNSTGLEYWGTGFCHIFPFLLYRNYTHLKLDELENLYQLIGEFMLFKGDLSEFENNYIFELKKEIVKRSNGIILK